MHFTVHNIKANLHNVDTNGEDHHIYVIENGLRDWVKYERVTAWRGIIYI